MNTLTEIEVAVDTLTQAQKEELFLFLVARLRSESGELPPPREFSREQLQRWIADDEAGYRRFLAS